VVQTNPLVSEAILTLQIICARDDFALVAPFFVSVCASKTKGFRMVESHVLPTFQAFVVVGILWREHIGKSRFHQTD
jgi:hypothetical protein